MANEARKADWILSSSLEDIFEDENTPRRLWWQEQLHKAKLFMETRKDQTGVLIEVAAQIPLLEGFRPGPEFTARLDRGAALFEQLSSEGRHVEIYVPGTRHKKDVEIESRPEEDKVSLSAAGTFYLLNKGIPASCLHGDNLSDWYKGPYSGAAHLGVYCSADECFVAGSYFKEQPIFAMLLCVASPHQARRKELHYVANGILPDMLPTEATSFHHDPTTEITKSIPSVLANEDPTFQAKDCELAAFFRRRRLSGYIATQK